MAGKDIAQLDKNFLGEEITYDGMKFHHVFDEPFKLYGFYNPYEEKAFKRLPTEVAMKLNVNVQELYKNTSGGRIRFRTDSEKILLRSIISEITIADHMPKTGVTCFDLYIDGEYKKSFRHGSMGGLKASDVEDPNVYDSNISLGDRKMRDILINFPLYNDIDDVFIGLESDATIEAPKEYTIQKPIVFYGSSITQGACASHPGNAYANQLSRRFDADFINLGFSSGGLAEIEMAEYIGNLDMSIFVYDYDHNAEEAEYLAETHERMFKIIRKMQPDLPIIMASAADSMFGEIEARRNVIKTTYANAIAAGDKNVYFIDGRDIYKPVGRSLCTVDHIHPNDLGFYMMANAFGDVIEKILAERK